VYELDMDLELTDLKQFKPNKPKVMHRVVINNRTMSIFGSNDYEHVIFAVELPRMDVEEDIE